MNSEVAPTSSTQQCRILSLDGGGAKGFYTLGVLKELEALAKRRLCEQFDLIFGTSTGAIIAALLALGHSVQEIHTLYKEHVPRVMRRRTARGRTEELTNLVQAVFGDKTFTDVKTGVGIVATRWVFEKPMIFKATVAQAHGRHATFVPGFGCTIAEAVQASCSAYPFFKKAHVTTGEGDHVVLIDGGYCANNPALYGIADAVAALNLPHSAICVLSIGVGVYPEPQCWSKWHKWPEAVIKRFRSVQLLQKTLNINTASMEQLRAILFKDIRTIRINQTFESPEMATDLLESDLKKLNLLYQRGAESFAAHEQALKELLFLPATLAER
ncbi:MAG: patatin-like phospholipase family protein [Vicinamibacterales bacterium]